MLLINLTTLTISNFSFKIVMAKHHFLLTYLKIRIYIGEYVRTPNNCYLFYAGMIGQDFWE